jgi:hypothetical protein
MSVEKLHCDCLIIDYTCNIVKSIFVITDYIGITRDYKRSKKLHTRHPCIIKINHRKKS